MFDFEGEWTYFDTVDGALYMVPNLFWNSKYREEVRPKVFGDEIWFSPSSLFVWVAFLECYVKYLSSVQLSLVGIRNPIGLN